MKLFTFFFILILTAPLFGESIFLKNGKIIQGKITAETDTVIKLRPSSGKARAIKRSTILRIVYTGDYRQKVYIKKKDNSLLQGYIVFEQKGSYIFRKELNSPEEKKLSKKDIVTISKERFSKKEVGPVKIAIMNFSGKDIPQKDAEKVTEMITGEIVLTKKFTVVERAKIEEILKEQSFQQAGCTDIECAVKMGRLVSARKILVGSVMKLGNSYIITGRLVDVEKGIAELSAKETAANLESLSAAATRFASALTGVAMKEKKIIAAGESPVKKLPARAEEKPEEKKKAPVNKRPVMKASFPINISASLLYLVPGGDFSEIAGNGYGVHFNASHNDFWIKHSFISLSLGVYTYSPELDNTDSILQFPLLLYGGYRFDFFNIISVIPQFGTGYLISSIKYDSNGAAAGEDFEYSHDLYFDPAVSVKTDIIYTVYKNIHISAAPMYTLFFEKEGMQQIFGAAISCIYTF